MGYLLTGIIILVASLGGLWVSLPGADGQAKPIVRNGHDIWIAIAITVGAVLGIGAIVVGSMEIFG